MKKIIVGFLSFVFLFVAQGALASVSWNGVAGDCPDINIATSGNGYGSPCWYGTNISANAGSYVDVKIYYHNTGNSTASNTHIKINAPTGSSMNHSFDGNITSGGGNNLYTNSVSVNIPSAQTLTWSATWWYTKDANGNLVSTPLLNGQNGSQVINSNGLYIGNIAPGWPTQGAVVARFQISNTQPPQACVINSFTASDYNITSGDASTLSWNTNSSCVSASIAGIGNVSVPNGNETVYPTNQGSYPITKTYVLTALSTSGASVSKSLNITVNPQIVLPMIGSLTSATNSCYIQSGQNSCDINFNWSVTNAPASSTTEVTTNQNGVSVVVGTGVSGSDAFPVQYPNSTFYLYNSSSVNALKSKTVSASCASGTSWNGSFCTGQVITNNCLINNFSISPTYINNNQSSYISWNTTDCSSVNVSGPDYNSSSLNNSGTTFYPTSSGNYVLTAYGSSVTNPAPRTIYVTVNNNQNNTCSISYFRADGSRTTTIVDGDSAELSWDTNGNCTSASINHGVGSVNSNSGQEDVYPSNDTTYTLTVYGNNGYSDTENVTVYVDDNNQTDNCSISYFNASRTLINSGDSSSLSWDTNGHCTSVSISNIGSVSASGTRAVYPTINTNYIIYAYGPSGSSDTDNVQINVNNTQPVYNTCAVTTVATNIGTNSATLNGIVSNSNSSNTYFEYGTSVYLGSQTTPRNVNNGTIFSEILTGLSPNTIYYYRLVSNCGGSGISNGAIEIFKTNGTVVNTNTNTIIRTIVQGQTIIGNESPVLLTIENRYQTISIDDTIDYTVTYKNIGKTKLTHPLLQVVLPKGVTFLKASRGTFSNDTSTLNVELNDLSPGDGGVVYLQGRVESLDSNRAQVVTTALLVYTNSKQAQQNAMAYVLNTPMGGNANNLTGLALFGWFGGLGLCGWLLLIIIILLLVLLFRRYFVRRTE